MSLNNYLLYGSWRSILKLPKTSGVIDGLKFMFADVCSTFFGRMV